MSVDESYIIRVDRSEAILLHLIVFDLGSCDSNCLHLYVLVFVRLFFSFVNFQNLKCICITKLHSNRFIVYCELHILQN